MNYILHVLPNDIYSVMGLMKFPLGICLSKGRPLNWFYQLRILDVYLQMLLLTIQT